MGFSTASHVLVWAEHGFVGDGPVEDRLRDGYSMYGDPVLEHWYRGG